MTKTASKRRYLPLKATPRLAGLMSRHYLAARLHRYWGRLARRPLAWVTSGAPVELLRAMGIFPVYPENYAALCATRRLSEPLCRASEAAGYDPDLCSYARCHLGSLLRPDRALMGGLPRPDLLVACNNICGTVLKWYQALARELNVPLFFLDTPFLPGRLEEHAVAYIKTQLLAMIDSLERLTGRSFNPLDLRRRLELSWEAVALWREIRYLCRSRPSPLNAPDLFVHMAPIVTLRGTHSAVGHYRSLRDEVRERVALGQAAIEGERHRLLWDNIALWHRLYGFYHLFSDHGACFVVDTYTGAWSLEMKGVDPRDDSRSEPLEILARTYAGVFLNQSLEVRAREMTGLIRDFGCDGFVMHSNRSCKPYSAVQEEIRRLVSSKTGRPGLIIESDMADPRHYAEESVRNRIQTFMESIQRAGYWGLI